MIDLHFDLLTKLYTSYLENDYEFILLKIIIKIMLLV